MRRAEENGASRPHRTYLVGGGRQHSLWGVADEDVGAPGVAFIRRDLRHSRARVALPLIWVVSAKQPYHFIDWR